LRNEKNISTVLAVVEPSAVKQFPGERLVRDEIFIRVRAARAERVLVLALVGGLVGVACTTLHLGFGRALDKVAAILAAIAGG
jgi:hypothetical protein